MDAASGAAAIDDESVSQVVRGHRHTNAVTGEYTNVVTTHTSRKLSTNESAALVHLDGVLATPEGILDAALHLQQVAFTHA